MTLPLVTPTGELPLAMNHLAESVANSAAFIALVGAADPTAAKDSIWIHTVPSGTTPRWPRPFALITVTEQGGRRLEAFDTMVPAARILLLFELETPGGMGAPAQHGDALYAILNDTEQIITEIAEQRTTAGRLAVSNIELQNVLHGDFDEEANDGDYWQLAYMVNYDQ